MFLQPPSSWQRNVNFVHPAAPTVGRTLAFVVAVQARTIVVVPVSDVTTSWWAAGVQLGGPGVICSEVVDGFMVAAILSARRYRPTKTSSPPLRLTQTHLFRMLLAPRDRQQLTLHRSLSACTQDLRRNASSCGGRYGSSPAWPHQGKPEGR